MSDRTNDLTISRLLPEDAEDYQRLPVQGEGESVEGLWAELLKQTINRTQVSGRRLWPNSISACFRSSPEELKERPMDASPKYWPFFASMGYVANEDTNFNVKEDKDFYALCDMRSCGVDADMRSVRAEPDPFVDLSAMRHIEDLDLVSLFQRNHISEEVARADLIRGWGWLPALLALSPDGYFLTLYRGSQMHILEHIKNQLTLLFVSFVFLPIYCGFLCTLFFPFVNVAFAANIQMNSIGEAWCIFYLAVTTVGWCLLQGSLYCLVPVVSVLHVIYRYRNFVSELIPQRSSFLECPVHPRDGICTHLAKLSIYFHLLCPPRHAPTHTKENRPARMMLFQLLIFVFISGLVLPMFVYLFTRDAHLQPQKRAISFWNITIKTHWLVATVMQLLAHWYGKFGIVDGLGPGEGSNNIPSAWMSKASAYFAAVASKCITLMLLMTPIVVAQAGDYLYYSCFFVLSLIIFSTGRAIDQSIAGLKDETDGERTRLRTVGHSVSLLLVISSAIMVFYLKEHTMFWVRGAEESELIPRMWTCIDDKNDMHVLFHLHNSTRPVRSLAQADATIEPHPSKANVAIRKIYSAIPAACAMLASLASGIYGLSARCKMQVAEADFTESLPNILPRERFYSIGLFCLHFLVGMLLVTLVGKTGIFEVGKVWQDGNVFLRSLAENMGRAVLSTIGALILFLPHATQVFSADIPSIAAACVFLDNVVFKFMWYMLFAVPLCVLLALEVASIQDPAIVFNQEAWKRFFCERLEYDLKMVCAFVTWTGLFVLPAMSSRSRAVFSERWFRTRADVQSILCPRIYSLKEWAVKHYSSTLPEKGLALFDRGMRPVVVQKGRRQHLTHMSTPLRVPGALSLLQEPTWALRNWALSLRCLLSHAANSAILSLLGLWDRGDKPFQVPVGNPRVILDLLKPFLVNHFVQLVFIYLGWYGWCFGDAFVHYHKVDLKKAMTNTNTTIALGANMADEVVEASKAEFLVVATWASGLSEYYMLCLFANVLLFCFNFTWWYCWSDGYFSAAESLFVAAANFVEFDAMMRTMIQVRDSGGKSATGWLVSTWMRIFLVLFTSTKNLVSERDSMAALMALLKAGYIPGPANLFTVSAVDVRVSMRLNSTLVDAAILKFAIFAASKYLAIMGGRPTLQDYVFFFLQSSRMLYSPMASHLIRSLRLRAIAEGLRYTPHAMSENRSSPTQSHLCTSATVLWLLPTDPDQSPYSISLGWPRVRLQEGKQVDFEFFGVDGWSLKLVQEDELESRLSLPCRKVDPPHRCWCVEVTVPERLWVVWTVTTTLCVRDDGAEDGPLHFVERHAVAGESPGRFGPSRAALGHWQGYPWCEQDSEEALRSVSHNHREPPFYFSRIPGRHLAEWQCPAEFPTGKFPSHCANPVPIVQLAFTVHACTAEAAPVQIGSGDERFEGMDEAGNVAFEFPATDFDMKHPIDIYDILWGSCEEATRDSSLEPLGANGPRVIGEP